jgi:hypothetical protein
VCAGCAWRVCACGMAAGGGHSGPIWARSGPGGPQVTLPPGEVVATAAWCRSAALVLGLGELASGTGGPDLGRRRGSSYQEICGASLRPFLLAAQGSGCSAGSVWAAGCCLRLTSTPSRLDKR